ncbi:hypothetical protein GXW82_31240 [Streptacidiphilus sp. 4-A2]|nr:hypothetical protein [Streptacidiphilus sp. 4-A2]
MSARSDRRWAELAHELEFNQLSELRRQAEGWRNGLTGLTALLTVLAVLKGRDDLAGLPGWARVLTTVLLALAFALLVVGSLVAVRASFGRPGEEILLGGQSLRRWTEQEVRRVGRDLWAAACCCVLGVVLVAAAVAVAWSTTTDASPQQLQVRTTTGSLCGELVGMGHDGLTLWSGSGPDRELRTVPLGELVAFEPVNSCVEKTP